jgi:hypothetical protein
VGIDVEGDDFTIMCMAAQGYNDQGASEKLKEIYRLVAASNPDNLANDAIGGRYTGYTDEELLEHMGDKSYVSAAFADRSHLKDALIKIKEADLGLSVVVTGNYETVFTVLKEVGLKPHTVNMSLGIFGNIEKVPEKEITAISAMCGHGMVTRQRIENSIKKVKSKERSPEEAGKELASTCTCGIFNPRLAAQILERISE